jgi:hypothetical protein
MDRRAALHAARRSGVEPEARWVIAEGTDAAAMSRSIPLAKAMDDAVVCLYQNGERVRPSNGYPVRLLLPGFEGNMNLKWLRRLKLTAGPAMTKDETSKYTIVLKDEKAWQFVFPIEVKSFITRPSPGLALTGPGFYEISGLAWSGNGSIRQVEVSADGGRSWAPAALQGPILPKAPVRSAQRGNGTAVPPFCRVAPLTTRAWCSQPAHNSPTSAACVASTTTTPSQAGALTRWGRPALKPVAVCISQSTQLRKCTTSSGLKTTGSFCGFLGRGISSPKSHSFSSVTR